MYMEAITSVMYTDLLQLVANKFISGDSTK